MGARSTSLVGRGDPATESYTDCGEREIVDAALPSGDASGDGADGDFPAAGEAALPRLGEREVVRSGDEGGGASSRAAGTGGTAAGGVDRDALAGDVDAGVRAPAPSLSVLRPAAPAGLSGLALLNALGGDDMDDGDARDVAEPGNADVGEDVDAGLAPELPSAVRAAAPFSRPAAAVTIGRVAVVPDRFLPIGRDEGGGLVLVLAESLFSQRAARERTLLGELDRLEFDELVRCILELGGTFNPGAGDEVPVRTDAASDAEAVSSRSISSVASRSISSASSSFVEPRAIAEREE